MYDLDYLFKKYQNELLAFVNTQFGRSYIGNSGREAYDPYPIFKIDRSGFHQFLGFNKGKPVARRVVYPGSKIYGEVFDRLFSAVLIKLEISACAGWRVKNPKLMPFVVPHFVGETGITNKLKNQLPVIYLSETTVNPQGGGGGGNTTSDGLCFMDWPNGAGGTWAQARDGAGENVNTTDTGDSTNYTQVAIQLNNPATTIMWFGRGFLSLAFGLSAGDEVTAAVMSIHGTDKSDQFDGGAFNINFYGATLANNNDIVAGDYDGGGTTAFCDTAKNQAAFSSGSFNDFTLNASGLTQVTSNQTGVAAFSFKNANRDVANSQPSGSAGQMSYFQYKNADTATNKPKMVITYTPALSGGGFALLQLLG